MIGPLIPRRSPENLFVRGCVVLQGRRDDGGAPVQGSAAIAVVSANSPHEMSIWLLCTEGFGKQFHNPSTQKASQRSETRLF